MADKKVRRFIQAIFDRVSAKKAEAELEASLAKAGKQGGENFLRELRTAFDKRMADLKTQLAKGLIDPKQFRAQANLAAKEFNTGVIAGMEKARAAGTLTDREYLKLARTLKKVGDDGAGAGDRLGSAFFRAGAAIAGFFAIRKLEQFFASSIRNAIEAEDSITRLGTVLGQLGLSYRQVAPEVEKYLANLQATTRFTDEDGREALVNLITITGDYRQALGLLDVTAKIAEKRHTTMAEAAQTAGDASRGLTKGMKDLGISTGETGNIVAKINANLGDLAVEGGKSASGSLAILNNQWGEFKEKVGSAIIGSSAFQRSMGDLKRSVGEANEFIDKNTGALTALFDAVGAFARHVANIFLVSARGWGLIFQQLGFGSSEAAKAVTQAEATMTAAVADGGAKRRALNEAERATLVKLAVEGGADLANLTKNDLARIRALRKAEADGLITLAKDQSEAITAVLAEAANRDKKLRGDGEREAAGELERIRVELAVKTLMLEQGLTEALAREIVRRRDLLKRVQAGGQSGGTGSGSSGGMTPQAAAAAIQQGYAAINQANTLLAAGFDQGVTPSISRTEQAMLALRAASDNFAQAAAASAEKVETPWTNAMEVLKKEFGETADTWRGFGQALEEGGLTGLFKFAAAKVKENLAMAIENAARALVALASLNPASAANFAAASATNVAAAGAWRVLAGGGGGGGGGGGAHAAGGGGSFSAGTPNLQRAADTKAASPEITIVLTGPGFHAMNPEVQEVLYGAMQQARERYGQDAHIRIKGAP